MTERRDTTALRAAAALAALAAAIGVPRPEHDAPRLRVVAVDVSASVAQPAAEPDASWFHGLGGEDRAAIVLFGTEAFVAAAPTPARDVRTLRWPSVPADGSSIAAALRSAAALRRSGPEGARLEVVVVTDGRFTDVRADVADALRDLRDGGGAEVRFVLTAAAPAPTCVRRLRAPGRIAAGEPFVLRAEGVAADGARVELSRDGTVVETRAVPTGPFRVGFARVEVAPGDVAWSAHLRGAPSSAVGVPAASVRTVVVRTGAVLVLGSELRPELAAALGGDVAHVDPRGGPDAVARSLSAFDACVVDDVPDALLGGVAAVVDAWVAQGGGAVLGGGESAFAAGGWLGRPVEAWSPLVSRPPDDAGSFLLVAVDGSGSMAEPWPGADPPLSRDAVARAAAADLVRTSGAGVRIALRRFSDRLLPDAAPPRTFDAAADGAALAASIAAFPPPGGATAILPVLDEAIALAAPRPERRRALLLITDGRSAEDVDAIRAALLRLSTSGVRVGVVVPAASRDGGAAPLLVAVRGTGGIVREATGAADLAAELVAAGRALAADEPIAGPGSLEPTPAAAGILAGAVLPACADRRNRTHAADGATVLLVADDGLPFAAVRGRAAGTVGAIAARLADPAWIDGGGTPLLRAMVAAVRRPAQDGFRIERTPDGTLQVGSGSAAAAAARTALLLDGTDVCARVVLESAGGGLLRGVVPAGITPDRAVLLDAAGAEVAAAGLPVDVPQEYLDPPEWDLAALASGARASAVAPAPRLRWPFAALGVVLLAASGVKWRARPSR